MSKFAKATVGLMVATILCKILGFAKELVLASVYGASVYSDIYIVSLNIPNVIFSVLGTAILTTFIPIYFEVYESEGSEKATKFTNNIVNLITLISLILVVTGIVFTESLVKVFAMGFDGEIVDITIRFTRILLVGMLFMGLTNIMTAYLQVKQKFTIPGLVGVPYNLVIMISILLSIKYGPYMMAIGTLVGMGVQFLYQLPFAYKNGYRYKLYINAKDKYIKKMMFLVGPVIIGVAVNQVNIMVDRTLASTLAEGSISALNYAQKLNLFVIGIFITSIVSVIYPTLSKLSTIKNNEEFIEVIVRSINSIILLVIPISIGAIVLANPIVRLLFQRGLFDERATNMTAIALVFYSIGLVGVGLRDVVGKIFYALQDTKTPMMNGAIAMFINIILNIILIRYMNHAGLALATSISSISCVLLLFKSLKKKIGYFGQDKIIKTALKSTIAALAMGIMTSISYNTLLDMLNGGFAIEILTLSISIVVGAGVYAILMYILKVEEINIIRKKLRRSIKI